jgi:DMSO/TMAO reductase YedYZ molybdopterin-dependent catalytic subunit
LVAVAAIAVVIVASSLSVYSALSLDMLDVNTDDLPSYPITHVRLSYDELINLPRHTVYAELYCFGSLVEKGDWTGVRLGLVIEKAVGSAVVSSDEGVLHFYATDGYSTQLDLAVAMREDIIIAYEINGRPLSEMTRLVIPYMNGAEWISMINQIEIFLPSYTVEISVTLE